MALSHKLAESFDAQRREIEEDKTTGLFSRTGLLRQTSLYQGRNLLALVHISNMNAIINSLSTEYGEKFISDYILRLHNLLPTNTLIARDTVDKLIVVFPDKLSQKSVSATENCSPHYLSTSIMKRLLRQANTFIPAILAL